MKTKCAVDLLVSHRKVFSIPYDTILDEASIVRIFASGYSRVPVYEAPRHKQRIRGILLTRQLIVVNKNEAVPLSGLPLYVPHCVAPSTNLVDLINLFQTGGNGRDRGGHLALVCARSHVANEALERGEAIPEGAGWMGIITLEDCLEALLQEQILDEKDAAGRLVPSNTSDEIDHNSDETGTAGEADDDVESRLEGCMQLI